MHLNVQTSRPPSPIIRFLMRGMLIVFVLIGISSVALGIRSGWRGYQSKTWPQVAGEIISSEVTSRTETRTRKRSGNGGTYTETVTLHEAAISYRFDVAGQTYESTRINQFRSASSEITDAQAMIKKFPAGSPVMVYYSSADPTECVIDPGVSRGSVFMVLFGMIFTFAGGISWWKFNR